MTVLNILIFILVFGGMVIVHEFGHYIVARLCKIEVEEFGIGLPTPGAITLWSTKGYLILKNGKRIEIPFNFKFPLNWNELIDTQAKITVDEVNSRLVLRTIEFDRFEEQGQRSASSATLDHVYVDQNGKIIEPDQNAAPLSSRKAFKAGTSSGAIQLVEVVSEVHPGTRFTLNWLPFGGFVRPKGENDPSIPGGLASANPWKRLAVLVAGPLMNLLTAVIIYSFVFNNAGVPDANRVLVASVFKDSPAEAAGFKMDDIFVSGNGQAINSFDKLGEIVDANENKPVTFVVERDGKQVELTATPKMNDQEKDVMIGVGLSNPLKPAGSILEPLNYGARYAYYNARLLISLPAQLIKGSLPAEQSRLVGLKGIYDIMSQSVESDVKASQTPTPATPTSNPFEKMRTILLIASLSISLGVFNLFPFPALDGGRIIFILPELIFRRRVSPQIENFVHAAGMAILLIFMLYVNVMDFVNPVSFNIP
ncbi:MAG: M50 family metallopeptidase [Anaerolineales bacterium]